MQISSQEKNSSRKETERRNVEQWKAVKDFEGYYEVSSKGQVRSVDRIIKRTHPKSGKEFDQIQKGKLLSQGLVRGYLTVGLYKNGEGKSYRVNRIVALAFIPNPNNFPFVGHDDDVKTNNTVENLYWTTALENATHNDKHLERYERNSKSVIATKEKEKLFFTSIRQAKQEGFSDTAIRNVLAGLSKTHKEYKWSYAN
jgi:hypothetical protein